MSIWPIDDPGPCEAGPIVRLTPEGVYADCVCVARATREECGRFWDDEQPVCGCSCHEEPGA